MCKKLNKKLYLFYQYKINMITSVIITFKIVGIYGTDMKSIFYRFGTYNQEDIYIKMSLALSALL